MDQQHRRGVLIVGAGGLGAPAALALVRAGIEELTLIDPDPVELSNLPRQIIYREEDVGERKVIAAARNLGAIAPATRITTMVETLDDSNAASIIASASFVIDATDNPAAKFLINDVSLQTGTPFVYGGVIGMTGQAMSVIPHRTACLRCLFEGPPDDDDAASCRDAGIVGPVAGAIGIAQANEALRYLRGEPLELAARILTYDARSAKVRVTDVWPRPGCACDAAQKSLAERGVIPPHQREA